MLEPEEVTTFLAIARQGNLRNAARIVYASQSTVSYRLQALEQRLGQPLVERGRGVRHISLTPAGQRFLRIAEQWEHLLRETERIHGKREVSLAVGAAHALTQYLLPPLYRWLGAYEPRAALRIETAGGPTLCDRVALHGLDAAFVFFDRAHAELSVDPFATSEMVAVHSPVCTTRLPATGVGADELAAGREIYMPWGPDFDLWRERVFTSEPFVTLETAHSLVPFLELPDTWSVVPRFAVAPLNAGTGCTLHRLADPPPDRAIYLVTSKRAASSAAGLELLRAGLQATADEFDVQLAAKL